MIRHRFLLNVYSKIQKNRKALKDRDFNQNTAEILSLLAQKKKNEKVCWEVHTACVVSQLSSAEIGKLGQLLLRTIMQNDHTLFSGMLNVATVRTSACQDLTAVGRKGCELVLPYPQSALLTVLCEGAPALLQAELQ